MSEQYISLAEIRDFLTEENGKRDLLTTQKAAMEHAKTVSGISADKAKELIAEVSQIPEVTKYTAVKIADLLPRYPEDIRAIFSKERVTVEPAAINRILETVSKYL